MLMGTFTFASNGEAEVLTEVVAVSTEVSVSSVKNKTSNLSPEMAKPMGCFGFALTCVDYTMQICADDDEDAIDTIEDLEEIFCGE